MSTLQGQMKQLGTALKKGDLLFVLGLFGTIVLLVVPVPALLLDLLLLNP